MKKLRIGKIITFAGAIVAFHIGSGFATGQEILQFFSAYGLKYSILAALLSLGLTALFTAIIMYKSKELALTAQSDVYAVFCGKSFGRIFKWITPVFMFLIFTVALSGAGAALQQYAGIPDIAGRAFMCLLSLITVLMGLKGVVEVIGKLGPIIIIFVVFIGIYGAYNNPQGLLLADEAVRAYPITTAAPSWWLSGISYAGFGILTGMLFLSALSRECISKGEAVISGLLGAVLHIGGALVLNIGLLANYRQLFNLQIPALYIAQSVSHVLAVIFCIILFIGIFTTAVPMLWSVCNTAEADDKSKYFKLFACLLSVIALVAGKLPFNILLGYIYPYIGYAGVLLLVIVTVNIFKKKKP